MAERGGNGKREEEEAVEVEEDEEEEEEVAPRMKKTRFVFTAQAARTCASRV